MSITSEQLMDEKVMKAFKRELKDMYTSLHLILIVLGMTKENATRVCNIKSVYLDLFDYEHKSFKLGTQAPEMLNKWKVYFGDKEKEEEFISSLIKN